MMQRVTCCCGARIKVSNGRSRQRFRCPACRQVLEVPGAVSRELVAVGAAVEPQLQTCGAGRRPADVWAGWQPAPRHFATGSEAQAGTIVGSSTRLGGLRSPAFTAPPRDEVSRDEELDRGDIWLALTSVGIGALAFLICLGLILSSSFIGRGP